MDQGSYTGEGRGLYFLRKNNMTIKELQSYLQIPRTCVYKLMREDGFPSAKINGRWKIDKGKLLKWIEAGIKQKEIKDGTKKK